MAITSAASRTMPSWKRPGSPIGRKGPRKAHPKYKRNLNKPWSAGDVRTLRSLARQNTPTRVIGLKLGRTEISVRGKAQREGISLRPANRSPYTRRTTRARRR
ncbi:MAG: hypothetical protein ACTHLY_07555 [Pseudolabrys sp.]